MPVVSVGDQEIEFPDDMSQDAIKEVLRKKFPANVTPVPVAQAPVAEPESPVNKLMAGIISSLAARTGRIATGIAGGVADLPVVAAQSAYDTTRSLQNMSNQMGFGANLPDQVAPAYKIPLPSEALKGVYDKLTNNAGNVGGNAGSMDQLAEVAAPIGASLAKVVPEAVKMAVPRAQGAVKNLAQRAMNEFNIPLRVDQIAPSRAMNTAQKISQEVPFSGVDASDANQLLAWNKSVAKTLGMKADNLGPDTLLAYKAKSSNQFKNILSNAELGITNDDVAALKNIGKEAPSKVGADSLSIVNSNLKTALEDIKPGTMMGDKLANIRTRFMENASAAPGGAKQMIHQIIDVFDDIAQRNLPPEKIQQLATARRQYRNYKTVEPLLEKSVDGNINPTELLNRVKSTKYIKASTDRIGDDDLVDLARIGKRFLVKKGGSDTFQKTMGGVGIGGLGTLLLTNPGMALQGAALAGTGMAANRGVQSLNTALAPLALQSREFNPQMGNLLTALTAGSLTKLNGE